MIIVILGILDVIAGIAVALAQLFHLTGSAFALYLGVIFILKALYSILTALAAGFPFDVLGWLDLIAGIVLMLLYWGFPVSFAFWVGIIMILKGVYSILLGIAVH